MSTKARALLSRLAERTTWSCKAPVGNPIAMGFIFYVLIVAMMLLGSATQYRFFYGNF